MLLPSQKHSQDQVEPANIVGMWKNLCLVISNFQTVFKFKYCFTQGETIPNFSISILWTSELVFVLFNF